MSKQKWGFEEWFQEQFGKKPESRHSLIYLARRMNGLRTELDRAEREFESRSRWIEMKRSASYAWNLKDGDKK